MNTNSVDPDQTPQNAASDLVLHYLPMSFLWDARHKWVKILQILTENFPGQSLICVPQRF